MNYLERSLGPYANLAQLAGYQLPAKHLPLHTKNKAINHLAGPYKTMIRGRGMEFEDVRLYQAGDDIRSIDWRVTARTGKPHTKQFREEREKPVFIVIDQRQNMFFGSQKTMKSVLATDLAAYIAWAALHKGDRVGGLVFNDTNHLDVRPRRQRKTVLQLLHHVIEYNHALNKKPKHGKRQFHDALLEVQRVCKPGTQIYIISDFHDLGHECNALLHDLTRHCEIIALKIYDPLESHLPASGTYTATNGFEKIAFDASKKTARDNYQQAFIKHAEDIRNLLGKYRIPLIPVSTVDSPIDILQQFLGNRS